jgi:hypothetical protein
MRRMWTPLGDANREHWNVVPLTNVGPLLGMTCDEVAVALGGVRPGVSQWGRWARFNEPAVTTYCGESQDPVLRRGRRGARSAPVVMVPVLSRTAHGKG